MSVFLVTRYECRWWIGVIVFDGTFRVHVGIELNAELRFRGERSVVRLRRRSKMNWSATELPTSLVVTVRLRRLLLFFYLMFQLVLRRGKHIFNVMGTGIPVAAQQLVLD